MSDRRKRYAAAMWSPVLPGHLNDEAWGIVDAAMAVADEEHELIREATEFHQRRYVAALEQNARLRAELDTSERQYRSSVETYRAVASSHSDLLRELCEARATIERVRAVLDEDPGWSPAELKMRIRDALNTPATVANPNRTKVAE